MTVTLDQEEWNRVLAVLSQAPWNVANPLIMRIGEQLRNAQAGGAAPRPNGPDEDRGLHNDGVLNQAGKPQ